jgi:hypothetical protein
MSGIYISLRKYDSMYSACARQAAELICVRPLIEEERVPLLKVIQIKRCWKSPVAEVLIMTTSSVDHRSEQGQRLRAPIAALHAMTPRPKNVAVD